MPLVAEGWGAVPVFLLDQGGQGRVSLLDDGERTEDDGERVVVDRLPLGWCCCDGYCDINQKHSS